MSEFKQHGDLARQIPAEVRARMRKAGVEDVDWYAGRLTSSETQGFSQVPDDEQRELRQAARQRRTERRADRNDAAVTAMRSLFAALRPRVATTRLNFFFRRG